MFIFHKCVLFMYYKQIFSKIYRNNAKKGGDLADKQISVIWLFWVDYFVVSNKKPSSSKLNLMEMCFIDMLCVVVCQIFIPTE